MSTLTAPAEPLQAGPPQTGSEHSPAREPGAGGRAPRGGPLRADALWWPTILAGGIICAVTFLAGGGLHLGPMTTVEMALTIGSGLLVAGTVLFMSQQGRVYGLWSAGLLLAFTALTALSVVWSVQPDDSFKDAGRMLAYSGVFGASVALARAVPTRWAAILGGITLAAAVVCGYALLTKVLPGQFDTKPPIYARLRAPFDYWNAIGLTAAMGVICCLWLAARRSGHALVSALAYPAMGLMLVTLLLAYSRGALAALALGLVAWFCVVPLRLRGAAVLVTGAVGAGSVVAWDFSQHALSTEGVALGARVTAGRQLGALLVAMLVLLTLVGLAVGFCTGRQAPSRRVRRDAGAALLVLLAVAVIAFAGALAVSHRGLTGSISHAFHALTDTNAKVPNTPGRLTAISSVRARYWKQALQVFNAHPVLGAGAEGYRVASLRYRTAPIEARHAHGFVVQTLADLGVVGLGLALALLLAWMAAAGRPTHPFNRRWTRSRTPKGRRWAGLPGWRRWTIAARPAPYSPERIGMLSMLCVVVVFGTHSLVDWTWYVPGNACVALLCAGWLAGRGPLDSTIAGERSGDGPVRSHRPSLRATSPYERRCRGRCGDRSAVGRLGAVAAPTRGRLLAKGAFGARERPRRSQRRGAGGSRTRSAVRAGAVLAGDDPAGDRSPSARPGHAPARGAPAALKPGNVVASGGVRPVHRPLEHPGHRRRRQWWVRGERAKCSDLPEPPVDRPRIGRGGQR